jgi:SAM-dependent methyltransferase
MAEPARWGLRRTALDVFDRLHLARPVVRGYELALAAKSKLEWGEPEVADGLPLPPARLRAQVGPSHADASFFLSSGREHSELIRDLLREAGTSVEDVDRMLDWGCGCGRVFRHWVGLPNTSVSGCDIDSRMVEWCAQHLPFADVTVTSISPPLPYGPETFDLVYAFSVFTHLTEELQRAWMAECRRVLKPDGYLLISTLGEHYASLDRLSESELQSFGNGNVVVLYERSAGTSLCSAYHPQQYVRDQLGAGFDYVSFRAAADAGRHDIHLFRKPEAIGASGRARAR